jgi:hypothetical protein
MVNSEALRGEPDALRNLPDRRDIDYRREEWATEAGAYGRSELDRLTFTVGHLAQTLEPC